MNVTQFNVEDKKIWLHQLVIQPYYEGYERIERAWYGTDFHSFVPRPLNWKERTFSFFGGVCLFVPLLNSIVWVAMQILGHAEVLSDSVFQRSK